MKNVYTVQSPHAGPQNNKSDNFLANNPVLNIDDFLNLLKVRSNLLKIIGETFVCTSFFVDNMDQDEANDYNEMADMNSDFHKRIVNELPEEQKKNYNIDIAFSGLLYVNKQEKDYESYDSNLRIYAFARIKELGVPIVARNSVVFDGFSEEIKQITADNYSVEFDKLHNPSNEEIQAFWKEKRIDAIDRFSLYPTMKKTATENNLLFIGIGHTLVPFREDDSFNLFALKVDYDSGTYFIKGDMDSKVQGEIEKYVKKSPLEIKTEIEYR